MKISVKRSRPHVYSVSINGIVHTLSINDLKTLVLETVRALAPGVLPPPSIDTDIHRLASRLSSASEANLQEFILHANEPEILIFLKSTEKDQTLHQKLFDNMSERKHTILSEDLQYSFQDGICDQDQGSAIAHLTDLANKYQL